MIKQSLVVPALLLCVLTSCYKETIIPSGEGLEDWTLASHSSSATPDYSLVFPQNKVNRLDITLTEENWNIMQADLDNLYGSTGGGPPGNAFTEETPVSVPCNVNFNGINWYYVGIRYKGNSSLSAYSQGVNKLPLRLEFDEFSNDYPEITGQTFYGFPALSMSSNYDDKSFMREKVGCDVFRNFGVPAPQTAFYEMYIDYGDGPVYFGLYTAVEVVFETMLTSQFGSNSGNCYKPDGDGAAWSAETFTLNDFENKTVDGTGGDDIQELYDILHDNSRTSDPAAWQTKMESVFDVDGFLKYLAVNTTIQNWDTYGKMTHNYYLYHDPADGLIKWIPWDNNEAFQSGKQGGALSFEFTEINDADWPMIKYILSVPAYETTFKSHISTLIETAFSPATMQAYYSTMQTLIQPSVEAETSDYSFINSISEFTDAISTLNSHVTSRYSVAYAYAN
jgi:spore coat protein H